MRRGVMAVIAATTLVSQVGIAAAQAPKERDLAAARKLFAEALKEEEQGQFEPALDKYRRVQEVKDTVPVRYRIGTSLEGLGRLKEALATFHAAIEMGRDEPAQDDVVHASEEHIAELERRIPQLLLIVSDRAPPDLVVEVDHERISESSLRTPLSLDPGSHDVQATAANTTPFHTQVALTDGAHVSLTIPLEIAPKAPQTSAPPRDRTPPGRSGDAGLRTAGIATMVGGGALLAGSVAALILRQSDIDTLHHACTSDGRCPLSREQELSSTETRAKTEGTLAAVLGITGLVALGTGGAFLFFSGSTRVAAAPTHGGAQVFLTAALP